ncbi:glutaredoxin family protein [Caldimonas caldifontis]|uniref:NrdH-redoxin n=1 Tax=Caldimonas caldifontis TaxID=1452508 RepID=A0A2S5SWB4_9BURK|nr:glutaredoxin family protein [Caldimonas caldifontis]PPE67041.1 NrdH-redoxin [Caldimonas caldifontis]
MKRPVQRLVGGCMLGLLATTAPFAQYKVVGPDGKVTYTDRPPVQSNDVRPVGNRGSGPSGGDQTALPFELRQVASRFPVVLYTSSGCQPCDAGRNLLRQRGIPHTERTIASNADTEALTRLAGGSEVPVLTVGRQTLRGYSPSEWNGYLDAAGYPKQSQLPATYSFPAATPLVATTTPAQPAPDAAAPAAQATSPSVPPPPAGNAPPGFRF